MKILIIVLLSNLLTLYAYSQVVYCSIEGPDRGCPGASYVYDFDDDCGGPSAIVWTITNGKVYNTETNQWVNYWSYDPLNSPYEVIIKWDVSVPIGSTGHINLLIDCTIDRVCNKYVDLGPPNVSPGTITGDWIIANCLNKSEIYISSTSSGWTLDTWSWTSNLQKVSQVGNRIRMKGKTTVVQGWETLTAEYKYYEQSMYCGSKSSEKDIWLNKPDNINTNPSGIPAIEAGLSQIFTIYSISHQGSRDLTWWTSNSNALDLLPGSWNCTIECLQTGNHFVYVEGNNECGSSSAYRQIPVNVSSGGGGQQKTLLVYPNPSTGELNIVINDADSLALKEKHDIIIYNEAKKVMYKATFMGKSYNFNLPDIKDNYLYLNVTYKNKIFQEILFVE